MQYVSINLLSIFLVIILYTSPIDPFFKGTPLREIGRKISTTYSGPTTTYAQKFSELTAKKLELVNKYYPLETKSEILKSTIISVGREVRAQETIADQAGRITFLHGEPTSLHARQHWYKVLFEATKNIQLDNYVFTRFPGKDAWTEYNLLDNEHRRKKVMANGCPKEWDRSVSSPSALYMSPTLFTGEWTSSCLFFFLLGYQAKNFEIPVEKIFNQYNLSNLYKKYDQSITTLATEYENICPFGQMQLLSFTPEAAQETVFPAYHKGVKIPFKDHQYCWKTVTDLYARIKHNPESIHYANNANEIFNHDNLQFCFVPTADYGLNPKIAGKGIQIKTIVGSVDPKKMAEYLVKEKDLTDQIRAEIQKL